MGLPVLADLGAAGHCFFCGHQFVAHGELRLLMPTRSGQHTAPAKWISSRLRPPCERRLILPSVLSLIPLARLFFFKLAHAVRGAHGHRTCDALGVGFEAKKRGDLRTFLLAIGEHAFIAQQQETLLAGAGVQVT